MEGSFLNWSPEQTQHYLGLGKACATRSIQEAAALCFEDCKLAPPVLSGAIAAAENALGCTLPDDLKQLYAQTNGVFVNFSAPFVMPLEEAVKENQTLRDSPEFRDLYMPFNHMLVFGREGNGDPFFFPIHADGSLAHDVFIWDHETDSRSYFANGVKDLFLRYATEVM